MSADNNLETTGLVAPEQDEELDTMKQLAYSILNDSVYNLLHDLCIQTFREEKMLRASSAAIVVEKKAAQIEAERSDESTDGASTENKIVETAGATWENGIVYVKDNPLKTTPEIRCHKCGLPRLLHPTDGNGGRRVDPDIEYCKKHPYIDKPYHDVYGQTFVPDGPGRGKKKKDMINPLKPQKENTPNGSQDSSPPPGEEERKPIQFPHSKCNNCNSHIPIRRMNPHMVKCIGGGGRTASRDAKTKMANGNGSQTGATPPTSRNSTPGPGPNGNRKDRSSPNKRDADELDSEESPQKKKKLFKKNPTFKLKAPKMAKNPSQLSASGLSFESKPPASDEEDVEADDDRDGDFNEKSISVKARKENKLKPIKKFSKPKILPPETKKIKIKLGTGESNGHIKAETREQSESSQTLSSPN